jgi:hypothetical protein
MTNDREFDALLDDALREYRNAEPLAGLEHRVLERLSAQSAARRQSWLRWSLAAACAAALVVAAWISSRPLPPPSQVGQASSRPNLPTPAKAPADAPVAEAKAHQPTRPATLRSSSVEASPRVAAHRVVPPVFPLPTPLTEQERAFMASLQGNSEQALGSEAGANVEIAAIQIKPLVDRGQSSGGNQ